ncbi:MAG: hypothetical protein L0Y35_09410, partial [Flammeovirgaceae bacterium]|nr:hypothetical protein [Flammeovirgaceae bacterium]
SFLGMRQLFTIMLSCLLMAVSVSCSKKGNARSAVVVRPKYHHSWYKDYTHKRKWHIGRIIRFQPEKQGVKRVKMKL